MCVCVWSQGSTEELKLSVDHIKQIICILRDFIRSPERRVMASTISKLKLDLDFDSTSINQIQLVLFGFQDSVSVTCLVCGDAEVSIKCEVRTKC